MYIVGDYIFELLLVGNPVEGHRLGSPQVERESDRNMGVCVRERGCRDDQNKNRSP